MNETRHREGSVTCSIRQAGTACPTVPQRIFNETFHRFDVFQEFKSHAYSKLFGAAGVDRTGGHQHVRLSDLFWTAHPVPRGSTTRVVATSQRGEYKSGN